MSARRMGIGNWHTPSPPDPVAFSSLGDLGEPGIPRCQRLVRCDGQVQSRWLHGYVHQTWARAETISWGAAVAPNGITAAVGYTTGNITTPDLHGSNTTGATNGFYLMYNADGSYRLGQQLSGLVYMGAAATSNNQFVMVGYTHGSVAAPQQGNGDILVRKYTSMATSSGSASSAGRNRKARGS
jgi:hypothetical protein